MNLESKVYNKVYNITFSLPSVFFFLLLFFILSYRSPYGGITHLKQFTQINSRIFVMKDIMINKLCIFQIRETL